MKKDYSPPPPPESPGTVADAQKTPKKRPWSKPTIRIVDGLSETTSGSFPSIQGEIGSYQPTS